MAALTGRTYSLASVSVWSCAPKKRRSCLSKQMMTAQMISAKMMEPVTEAVKYSFDRRTSPSAFPRIVLKRTDPPVRGTALPWPCPR